MEKIKVLVVPSDTIGGVGFYRSIQPHVQLQEQYGSDFDVTISPDFNWANLEEVKKYKIIIEQIIIKVEVRHEKNNF